MDGNSVAREKPGLGVSGNLGKSPAREIREVSGDARERPGRNDSGSSPIRTSNSDMILAGKLFIIY